MFDLSDYKNITNSFQQFRAVFPCSISVVPRLEPFQQLEHLETQNVIEDHLETSSFSRFFRNYWLSNAAKFEDFKRLVSETWTDSTIEKPEVRDLVTDRTLYMMYQEERIPREIAWAGNGFQIWLQMLTHILRPSSTEELLVFDEPELYLHPDLQRKLVTLLRRRQNSVLLATHSIEMINEVPYDHLVFVDKGADTARRLLTEKKVQNAINIIGSHQNIYVSRLAKAQRVLFVEGRDIKFLRLFGQIIGNELLDSKEIVALPLGGYTEWRKLAQADWSLRKVFQANLQFAILLDRDYRADEEIAAISEHLSKFADLVHIWKKKEIENYILIPEAMHRSLLFRTGKTKFSLREMRNMLSEATEKERTYTIGHLIEQKFSFIRPQGLDLSTVASKVLSQVDENWSNLTFRLSVLPAKRVLSILNQALEQEFQAALSFDLILAHTYPQEVDRDVLDFFSSLSQLFR